MDDADLHPNARAVVAAAAQRGLHIEPVGYPEGTRTAEDAARAIGCQVGQIVKSLVFAVGPSDAQQLVLALVSGANQLDERKLGRASGGDGRARRVDAEVVRAATGFPIGGVPPLGLASALPVYVDPDLLGHDQVWAAAGTPRHVFGVEPEALVAATEGTVVDLRR
jgi:prolyl-tRNA editing enzyme YbaK/EbsC (Cys-tRNA(Pro) deacylase)